MKPYSKSRQTKGLAGCRKSKASAHRKRSLRVDKKAARQNSITDGKTWEDDTGNPIPTGKFRPKSEEYDYDEYSSSAGYGGWGHDE